jgi:hypothetical protein
MTNQMQEDKFFEPSKQNLKVLVPIIVVLLLAWGALFVHGWSSGDHMRYRITVTIDTPDGPKVGTAVHEVYTYSEMRLVPGQGGKFYALSKGEAVEIDLGTRGTLFLLLGDEGESWDVFNHMKDGVKTFSLTGHDLVPEFFVMFSDMNDPTTAVEIVTEEKYQIMRPKHRKSKMETFEEAFGAGVALRSVSYEVTADELTWGIEKRLPWLIRSKNGGGGIADSPDQPNYLSLYLREFSKGGPVL